MPGWVEGENRKGDSDGRFYICVVSECCDNRATVFIMGICDIAWRRSRNWNYGELCVTDVLLSIQRWCCRK